MWLGSSADGHAIKLDPSALLRHAMALGSSGSGKTVFCKAVVEEAVLAGIPAICVDPQGDLASLGAGVIDAADLEAHGLDPAIAAALDERAEVVIFTPGSSRGVPLCADPVDAVIASLEGAARVDAVTRTAAIVVGLLGFDLDSDDGAGLAAVIDRALNELVDAGATPSLAALTEELAQAEKDDFAAYARYLDARKVRLACQRLARLEVGSRRELFHDGVPIDVDLLLGRDPRAPVAPGKTRVAIVYLNTLHQQEDKDFFVAALADRLYAWMLAHPSPTPQALFYIDEVAPFIPPVRKPACKEGLSLLFKQARKYGVACVMATQNPGDVDYKAMAQFGTWALGRLTTRQDRKKVEPVVKSLAPSQSDAILDRLPSLKPGELVLISPDQLGAPVELYARWLMTRHETWTEERVAEHTEAIRSRFAALLDELAGSPREVKPAPRSRAKEKPEDPPLEEHQEVVDEELGSEIDDAGDGDIVGAPALRTRRTDRTDEETLAALTTASSAGARELASALDRSEGTIRRALGRLVADGRARAFERGRAVRYFATSSGARPDLDLPGAVRVLASNVDADAAAHIAASHARTRVLALLGDDEKFERAEPLHRLLLEVEFEEKVERSVLARLFGDRHDERVGSVYLHPHTLGVLVFTNADGMRFDDAPAGPASEIHGLGGLATRDAMPGTLSLDDHDVLRRKTDAAARERFASLFHATPRTINSLYVPLWQLFFRGSSGSLRRVTIDAVIGRAVQWPAPT